MSADWAQVWVGLAGNVLLFATIIIGSIATFAAVRASRVAESSLRDGSRAYITIKPRYDREWKEHNTFSALRPIMEVHNSGATPAINCVCWIAAAKVPLRDGLAIVKQAQIISANETNGIFIGSKETSAYTGWTIPADQFSDLYAGRFAVYLFFHLKYNTLFERDHTHFSTCIGSILMTVNPTNIQKGVEFIRLQAISSPEERSALNEYFQGELASSQSIERVTEVSSQLRSN